MYTLDQFISRLQNLRTIAGGEAPVVVLEGHSGGDRVYESAAVQLQMVTRQPDHSPSWIAKQTGNDTTVISVF